MPKRLIGHCDSIIVEDVITSQTPRESMAPSLETEKRGAGVMPALTVADVGESQTFRKCKPLKTLKRETDIVAALTSEVRHQGRAHCCSRCIEGHALRYCLLLKSFMRGPERKVLTVEDVLVPSAIRNDVIVMSKSAMICTKQS